MQEAQQSARNVESLLHGDDDDDDDNGSRLLRLTLA